MENANVLMQRSIKIEPEVKIEVDEGKLLNKMYWTAVSNSHCSDERGQNEMEKEGHMVDCDVVIKEEPTFEEDEVISEEAEYDKEEDSPYYLEDEELVIPPVAVCIKTEDDSDQEINGPLEKGHQSNEENTLRREDLGFGLYSDIDDQYGEGSQSNTEDDETQESNFREKKYRCTFCPKSYKLIRSLRRHIQIHDPENEFQCEICQKRFKRRELLNNHTKLHTGDAPHCCSICGKLYIQRRQLERHMRCHSGERPFQCTECNKSFVDKAGLNQHVGVHAKDNSFRCSICNKFFNERRYLQRHMRTHSEEKPYKCDVCNKTFLTNLYLTTHMRIHSKERPFQCSVCLKSFGHSSALSKHRRIHKRETFNYQPQKEKPG